MRVAVTVWGNRIGQAMSPPLIRKVCAAVDNKGLVIIDAPPGTSCPVIAAMRGADFIADGKSRQRLVSMISNWRSERCRCSASPADWLVINRADMGNDRVRE